MDSIKKYLNLIEDKTHTWLALISGCVLLIAAFMTSDGFLSKYVDVKYLKWTYPAVFIAWIVFWLINRFWITKCKKNKVGLVLCIYADTSQAEQALKNDFLTSIKRQIANEQLGGTFDVIVVKNHLSQKFNNATSIKNLHKRVKSHIYIFGEVKKRKDGIEQYFLSLDGLVLHRPIPQNVSNELSKDFLATLPKAINFSDEFSFRGFQISSSIVVKSVEYIVGIASYLSGDPMLAISLHEKLKQKVISSQPKSPFDQVILTKIDTLLANEYALRALYFFYKNDPKKTRDDLVTSFKLNAKCYRALLLGAIIAFAWDNNPNEALKIIKKCHGVNMPEWRYSEAFLHFWEGNYPTALKACEKIKKQNYEGEFITSAEVIQFNEQLIKTTNKPALYFWLGFNYYFKQNNKPSALQNFELFEQKSDTSMSALKQKSSAWLTEIKQKMAIK